MLRSLLALALVATTSLAQTAVTPATTQVVALKTTTASTNPAKPQATTAAKATAKPAITINGLCEGMAKNASPGAKKISRQQFDTVIDTLKASG